MQTIKLRTTQNNKILFEGRFPSFKECLEQAIFNKIPLHHIDLTGQDLSNANLDNAQMGFADFTGTNLTGANLSESYLRGSNFENAALYNTCLCLSNISECNFQNTSFGGTDIFGTILCHSTFSTLSAFSLDFGSAQQMQNCRFVNAKGKVAKMSRPPIIIQGLSRKPIIIMDNAISAGHNTIKREKLIPLAQKLTHHTLRKRLTG